MYSVRIKKIRETLNLSVAKLSKKIGIAERTIVSYESEGRTPSLDFLAQLCKILEINPSWFLFGNGEMFNKQPSASNDELEQKVVEVMKKYGVIEKWV